MRADSESHPTPRTEVERCGVLSGIAQIVPGDTGPIRCDRLKGHDGPHEGHDSDQSGEWNGWNARRSWKIDD